MERPAWMGPACGAPQGRAAGRSGCVGPLLPALALVLSLLFIAVAPPNRAIAQPAGSSAPSLLTVGQTEELARRVDYEGLPADEAKRIGPEGAARLVEMLADPKEAPHHARILLALGIWGGEGALEAMRAWESFPLDAGGGSQGGEVDRDRFRAWQVLPFALGQLAHRDPRAVAELAARFDADAPTWSFRQFKGARLQRLEQRSAAAALAETRLPEADRVLDAVARRAGDPALSAHVREVRAAALNAPTDGVR